MHIAQPSKTTCKHMVKWKTLFLKVHIDMILNVQSKASVDILYLNSNFAKQGSYEFFLNIITESYLNSNFQIRVQMRVVLLIP